MHDPLLVVDRPMVTRIPAELYHADPCDVPSLSSSLAKVLIDKSPRHAWVESRRLNPDWRPTNTEAFDIGKAAHRMVLGAGEDYVRIPDELLSDDGGVRTKAAREWVQDARSRGLTPVKSDVADRIGMIAESTRARLALLNIEIDETRTEMAAFGHIDGAWVRAMVDYAPSNPNEPLYDFKTAADARPDALARRCVDYGYVMQAAHYLAAWEAATGEQRRFRLVFAEKEPPYEIAVIEITQDALAIERKFAARAREVWAKCVETNVWPGYPLGVFSVELPDWYVTRRLDQESQIAEHRRSTGRDVLAEAYQWQAPWSQD